ncbi:YciI family protein [Chryseobacterium sp. MYb264]|uniref:YciI family protein n=1 Tax=Chryseobacterium sp. MYb264 TaxID=2745153 RepID=UPI002E0DA48F|nr:YciI family protein [Chryseobacterium sp. MYb264]
MLFIVRCQDNENKLSIREKYTEEHKKFLEAYKDHILVPGSLRLEVDGAAQGSIWIVDAETKEQVREICNRDPFFINGLRKSVDIFIWNKVFPETKTLI